MKKILLWGIISHSIFISLWANEMPKISIPTENAIITQKELFIFIQVNPIEIENQNNIKYVIFKRSSGQLIVQGIITPSQNYEWNIPITTWEKGEYLLKVIFTDKRGNHNSSAAWRNFVIK